MHQHGQEEMDHEKELLILLRAGNERAFEKIYQLYSIRILKKLIRLIKHEEIAKEILQDIFLKVWEKREDIDPDRSFRSYLFRITENKVTDLFRKAALDKKLFEHIVAISTQLYNPTEENIGFKETNSILEQAISALPPQRRKIFMLCKIEGKTYEEAAGILGISAGTVNDHMVKALRTIKTQFDSTDLALTLLIAAALTQAAK